MKKLRHVAIILDGNGRWASQKGRHRTIGHIRGAQVAIKAVEWAVERKLETLTLWGFSSENWKRPQYEVKALMRLFQRYGVREAHKLDEANIRVTFNGSRSGLPSNLVHIMDQVEKRTVNNTGLHLLPAINFCASQSAADAANRLLVREEAVTKESLETEMQLGAPPYDLLIRTAGEQRVSNFPAHHAELVFRSETWPEVTPEILDKCVDEYNARKRTLGAAPEQLVS